jgi:hypothetical protein
MYPMDKDKLGKSGSTVLIYWIIEFRDRRR